MTSDKNIFTAYARTGGAEVKQSLVDSWLKEELDVKVSEPKDENCDKKDQVSRRQRRQVITRTA